MKQIINKFLYSFIVIVILINYCGGLICSAMEISDASIISKGVADYHLKYFREDTNSYRYIICAVVGYYNNDNFYPAYCMNKDLKGVDDEISYSVNVSDVINRDDVWRVVRNGYPYKSYQEIGVANEFDAFAVTKFAVYCITGQSDLEKFYAEPDDEEAIAMLNALKNLVNIRNKWN